MRNHEITKVQPLLNEQGNLAEPGWSRKLVQQYDRKAIKALPFRIKEWDYYLIYNDRFAIALTMDDNAYMSMLSASFIDFTVPGETTVSPIGVMPMGKVNLPASSAAGVSKWSIPDKKHPADFTFTVENGVRKLQCKMENFKGGKPFVCDITLSEEPRDSMVIATPFAGAPKAFYYNQKINCLRADGWCQFDGRKYVFDPSEAMGVLDWGRGVWTYKNTWYWGSGSGWVNGQREKANALVCPIVKPMGYIALFTESGSIVGKFTVDGKVSSLNSFLTPDSEYYAVAGDYPDVEWLADVDGSYGENDNGIFFFTIDGKYVEWTGTYLYSDIPFEVDNPVVRYAEVD